MKRRNVILVSGLGVVVLAALVLDRSGSSPVINFAGLVLNTFRAANSPPGTLVVELRHPPTVTAVGTAGAAHTSSRENVDPSASPRSSIVAARPAATTSAGKSTAPKAISC